MRKSLTARIVLLLLLCATTISAGGPKGVIGFKYGNYGPAKVSLTNKYDNNYREFFTRTGLSSTDGSYTFGIMLDIPVAFGFLIGGSVDLVHIDEESYKDIESNYLKNVAMNLKLELGGGAEDFTFRPAIAIGYAQMPDILTPKPVNLTLMRVFIEALYMPNKVGVVIDIGRAWSIDGGNEQYNMEIRPFMVYRVGIVLGK